MKKKLLITLLAITAALCCAFGFTACGGSNESGSGNEGGNGSSTEDGSTEKPKPSHTHNYAETVIAPTCTESGYTLHTCGCGESYKDKQTDPLGHALDQFEAKEPTCTETGWKAYEACKRSECTYTTKQDDLPMLGHVPVVDKGTPETCTEDGISEGTHCDRCKDVLIMQEIIQAIGHDYVYEKLPDEHSVTCSRCEENFNNEQHDWDDNVCTKCKYEENAEWSKGLVYALSSDNSYYSVCGIGSCEDEELLIPERYNGLSVKEIEYGAFKDTDIVKVIIPDSVERLRDRTFVNCLKLTSVTLGKGLKYIGGNVFMNTPKLTEINYNTVACENAFTTFTDSGIETDGITVNIGAEVTCIPDNLFKGTLNYGDNENPQGKLYYAKITEVNFSDDSVCTVIGNSSFSENAYLENITLPECLKTIGSSAFYDCTALNSITVPKNVETVGSWAFKGLTALTSMDWNASKCVTLSSNTFGDCGKNSEELVVCFGEEVVKIPERMFSQYADDKSYLTEVRFDRNSVLKEIGAYAFADVATLSKITLPESLIIIGEAAFDHCPAITQITVPNSVQTVGRAAFFGCELTEITLPFIGESRTENSKSNLSFIGATTATKVTITYTSALPDKCFEYNRSVENVIVTCAIKNIGANAFHECTALENISFAQVENIGDYAFYGCTALENISLDGLTEIGSQAFVNCTSLKSLVLPETLIKIGSLAFFDDSGLQKITIGKNVAEIGVGAFYNCKGLTEIDYRAKICTVNDWSPYQSNVFGQETNMGNIFDANEVENNSFILTVGAEVQMIPANMFRNSNIKELIWENDSKCERIGASAFYNCKLLTTFTLPDSLKIVESDAFNSNYGIKYNSYQNGYYLGSESNPYLMLCRADTFEESSFFIHEDTVIVGAGVFANKINLTTVNMPKNLTCIGNNAFFGSNLTNFTIPDGVIYIGAEAFVGTQAENLYIPDSVIYIGNRAFGIDNLMSIYIGANAAFIGESICRYSNKLSSITVSQQNAYYHSEGNCLIETKTKKLIQGCFTSEIPADGTVEILGNSAFWGSGLASISIPESVKIVEDGVFAACENLTSIEFLNGVISIGAQAFDYCPNLKNIYLPDSLTYVGRYMFGTGYDKTEVELTEYSNALYLGSKTNPYLLLVKAVSRDISECTIHKDARLINEYAFADCSNLISLTIPENIIFIGKDAFMNCTHVAEINYNATKILTPISNDTRIFGNVGKNTDGVILTIGANVTGIPAYMFWIGDFSPYAMPNIISIVFEGRSVCESIGEYAFYGVSSITNVTLPDSVVSIGKWAFSGCDNLSSVYLGSVTVLEEYVFAWTALTEFPSGGNIREIKSMALDLCPIKGCIELPKNMEILETSLFNNNTEIESIIIYNSVTAIKEAAINGCLKLKSIYFYGTEEEWGNIKIAERNYELSGTKKYFYAETEPEEAGNYWHYVDGEVVEW